MIMEDKIIKNSDYTQWINSIKSAITQAQIKASIYVNSSLIELYWHLGKEIVQKQSQFKWGSSIIDELSKELHNDFSEIQGFSRRNLYAIRQWYLFYSQQFEKVPQVVAQIPWGHNRMIVSKIKDINEALFYSKSTIQNGWSRNVLNLQIENNLYERSGKALTNFAKTLPKPHSDLAQETLKDPYNFDFLEIGKDAQEREIEKELTKRITNFLLELGKGFAFIGRQVKIEISNTDYFIDLLFYHLDLRCYVVIELKAGKFKPEYAGKLNFYLSAVDSQKKEKSDNPSIGLILCKEKDKIEAEYSLRDINKPIGISNYILTNSISENIQTKLPTIEELESELSKYINE
ncbi:MAG: PDDEXK nuclease domain-containing protein [Candidatus Cloacimonadales bacterium]|nr:PDDEXK nuclease domain-containing protein [Candidatus Cloacimonadales bacterium]